MTKSKSKSKAKPAKAIKSETKNKTSFWFRHPLIIPVVVFVGLFFVGLAGFVALSGQTVGADDKRIVQIFYDGKAQTIPTRSKNVQELLTNLNLKLGDKDVVEPTLKTPIIEDNFKINIYRARSVQVIDGNTQTVVQTTSKNPATAAKEAGLQLVSEDLATFESPNKVLNGPVVAEKLIVVRSVPVQVSMYGVLGTYRTRAKNIQEFLTEKNINLKDGETTQPAEKKTPIVPGMLLSINLPGKQIISVEEPIPYTSTTKNNPNLAPGKIQVVQAGSVGKRAVLYEQTVVNGIETGRRPLQTITLVQPIEEIKEKGTQIVASYSVDGSKTSIMAAAGIDPSQYGAVDYIISHESHWNAAAINSRGCIGLGQRCPSGGTNALVSACPSWQSDPVCQLVHFSGYANSRYGSWNAAYSAWLAQGWW